jgi:hypothetical protein
MRLETYIGGTASVSEEAVGPILVDFQTEYAFITMTLADIEDLHLI